MKTLKEFIIEAKYQGTYFVLNKSGIAGNKKLTKMAKEGGVKYNDEYWFVSGAGLSKEDAEEMKNQSHLKNNDDFVVVAYDDIQSGYGK